MKKKNLIIAATIAVAFTGSCAETISIKNQEQFEALIPVKNVITTGGDSKTFFESESINLIAKGAAARITAYTTSIPSLDFLTEKKSITFVNTVFSHRNPGSTYVGGIGITAGAKGQVGAPSQTAASLYFRIARHSMELHLMQGDGGKHTSLYSWKLDKMFINSVLTFEELTLTLDSGSWAVNAKITGAKAPLTGNGSFSRPYTPARWGSNFHVLLMTQQQAEDIDRWSTMSVHEIKIAP